MTTLELGFLMKPLQVPIDNILPSRAVSPTLMETQKYRQIRASIQEIGLIEPLSVAAVDRETGQHLLLDGHIRLIALRELGWTEIPCLVAKDDESYTYNNRINRLSPVQEHIMIRQAVAKGVSPDRLAAALCVDVGSIRRKLRLLNGICPEAIELLKDRQFAADITTALRQMKPTRQVECAELMISANNLTVSYAKALLAATSLDMLIPGSRRLQVKGISQEEMGRMEKEMLAVQGQYKSAEQTYGEDMLNLVLARGYVAKLIQNEHVERFLRQHQGPVLEEFISLVKATAMDL